MQDTKHSVSSCVVFSAPSCGRTLVAEVLLSLRGKHCNVIVIMLYKGAFVSFAIHCSNRVISKNMSNAGSEAALEPEKVCMAGVLGGAGLWVQMEPGSGSRAGQSCQGAPGALP